MKITQIFKIYWPDNGGGIAKVMESIADALPECEHQMLVCQSSRHKKSANDTYKGIAVRRSRQMFEFASTPVSFQFLRDVREKTEDADFVICHFPYPMADLAVLLGLCGGRLVVWWHCGFEKYAGLAPFYGLLARHTLKKAKLILVSSKGNLKSSGLLWQYRKKCRVIPFCVSDAYVQRGRAFAAACRQGKEICGNGQGGRQCRSSPDSAAGMVCILFIGRLVWYKGCDVLLRSFAKMKQKNCRLVLVGSGPLEKELKCLAASLKLKRVVFKGILSEEEKIRQIEACDFLVLPSISKAEAFAIVQLEAMAFGKPVINTALQSGVPYVSIHKQTGITVKPGSVRELAKAMDELAANEALRFAYGENALQRVQKYFTRQAMAKKYRRIFSQQNTVEKEKK
ncbi:MAG: glycosyltransferase [Eubacterium sp.]|nr:glycosyltransferase [Eubacterium sp.]